jgi:hypothetical protein
VLPLVCSPKEIAAGRQLIWLPAGTSSQFFPELALSAQRRTEEQFISE